jgi:hypothetical protein
MNENKMGLNGVYYLDLTPRSQPRKHFSFPLDHKETLKNMATEKEVFSCVAAGTRI